MKFNYITCPNCKFEGYARKKTNGSFLIELILWLFVFPLGLFYTLWRFSTKRDICPRCRFENVYPLIEDGNVSNSPKGGNYASKENS